MKDSWNQLGLVISARVDPRPPAVSAGGGLTLTVVDGFWWNQVFGMVWLEGVGHLGGVEGQRNPLPLTPLILGIRSCREEKKTFWGVHLIHLSGETRLNAP